MSFKDKKPDAVYLVSLDGKTWEHKTGREIQKIINPKQELYYDDLKIKEIFPWMVEKKRRTS